jgi:hypothetical protein
MVAVLPLASEKVFQGIGHTFDVSRGRVIALLALTVVGGLIVVAFSLAKKPMSALAATALLIAGLLVLMNVEILPSADSRISARSAAQDALRLNPSRRNIMVFGLSRDWMYGMDYYFGRELPEWTPGTPLPEWVVTTSGNSAIFERLANQIQVVSRVGEPLAVLIHIPSPTEKLP